MHKRVESRCGAVAVGLAIGNLGSRPVLHQSSSSMHTIVTTPAESLGALIARFPKR